MDLDLKHKIKKAHIVGQHCQRNYDLSRSIPEEDIDLILHAATQCPSKQNLDYYSIIAIQDRAVIEEIYNNTVTAVGRKNPQVLGQLLLVFVSNSKIEVVGRNAEIRNVHNLGNLYGNTKEQLKKNINVDMHQAIGVAAGYVNLTASLLGYRTGCNKCFNHEEVEKILNIKDEQIVLMMGIGINDTSRNRREEHFENFMIESYKKIPIAVKRI